MIVTYFSTAVGEFIHYSMLKTWPWVPKTERMSVKFKDSLFKATACIKISLLRRRRKGNCWQKYTQATDLEDIFNHS